MANDPSDFQDLVAQFVRGSIRRPIDTLGVRRTDVSFTDIQEAAAGVFLMYPKAPFYVLFLAAQRLQELIEAEAETIDELMRLLGATGRTVLPIKDLTPLSNITSALFELERAIGQRTEAFKDITDVPAFKRFDENVQRFLEGPGLNVKDGGELIETPQEARSRIPDLVNLLQLSHAEILRRAALIQTGLTNFEQVNLPALAASGVISRSRQVIQSRATSMADLSPIDRLTQNKDAILELISSRAIVQQFGSFSRPASVFSGDITATALVDALFPGEPSSLQSEKPYYRTQDGFNVLDFFLDEELVAKFEGSVAVTKTGVYQATFTGVFTGLGIVPTDVVYIRSGTMFRSKWTVISANSTTLVCSGVIEVVNENATIQVYRAPDDSVQLVNAPNASIDGLASEPITLYSGSSPMPGTFMFRFFIDSNEVFITLILGADERTVAWDGDWTFQTLVTALNDEILDQIPTAKVLFEGIFAPPKVDTIVTITDLGGNNYRATVVSNDLEGYGIAATQHYLKPITGPNKGMLLRIMAVGASPMTYVDFEATAPLTGPFPAQERVQLGNKPRLRLRATDAYDAQTTGLTIRLSSGYGNSAAFALGFSGGRTSTASRLKSLLVAEDITGKADKLEASAAFQDGSWFTQAARTDPLAPTRIVMAKYSGTGSVVASGLNVTLTTTFTEEQLAGIDVGDDIVFRTSTPINTRFDITSIVGNVLTATGTVGISTQTTVEFDIVDNAIPGLGQGFLYTMIIDDGPNSGRYDVKGKGPTLADFDVSPQLPLRQDVRQDPVPINVSVGLEFVRFASLTDSINSSVTVHGSAVDEFFFSGPSPRGGGQTRYLLLSALPTGLQVEDSLEYYEDDYNEMTDSYEIEEVVFSANVIKLDRPVPNDTVFEISQNRPPPFALLRAKAITFTNGLESRLGTWASLPQNQELFFTDLNRFINPLLVNTNPTVVQVADAQAKLKDLYKVLTEVAATEYGGTLSDTLENILDAYDTEHQPPIDTMVKTFIEKGADKAVDILLSADFTGFFSLDVDGASYAGDMMKKMRDLAREDLPIRRTERLATQQSQLLASTDAEDFETSTTDTNVPKTPTG